MSAESQPRVSLTEHEQHELLSRARLAMENSHSPYSSFRVGAALRSADGVVWSGCNVENASFGLTVCAERTALVKAVSEGVREFDAVAIVTDGSKPTMPCGACRQALAEFCADELIVVVESASKKLIVSTLGALLPRSFRPSDLHEA